MRYIRALLSGVLAAGALCQAQSPGDPSQGPDRNSHTFVPGVEVLPYTGLPFTGTSTIMRVRAVAGGGTVTSYGFAKVVRDSQGRLYRERHHLGAADADPQRTLTEFFLLDPVAHTRTDCVVATHRCTISGYHPRLKYAVQPAGSFDNGRRILARESLGQQTIDGRVATGTRETTTLMQGVVGNDQMLTLTRELWYSAELKTNLLVIRKDPREGTETVGLKVLSQSEPEPSAFAVPEGYTTETLEPTPPSRH